MSMPRFNLPSLHTRAEEQLIRYKQEVQDESGTKLTNFMTFSVWGRTRTNVLGTF